MQFQPVFGKSILLGASICWLFGGCAVHGPIGYGPRGIIGDCASCGPSGAGWEAPSSPDWPVGCMPEGISAGPAPLLDYLARSPHRETPPEAPPHPRFHPLPTRPMFSPAADSWPVEVEPPAAFGTLPPSISGGDGMNR